MSTHRIDIERAPVDVDPHPVMKGRNGWTRLAMLDVLGMAPRGSLAASVVVSAGDTVGNVSASLHLTPGMARELAAALVSAADRAETTL